MPDDIFFKILIHRANGIRKIFLFLEVGGSTFAPPKQLWIRIVLHREPSLKSAVCSKFSCVFVILFYFVRRELKFCCYDAFPVRKNDWRGVSLSGKTYSRGMTWGRPDSIWKFYLENFFSENLHLVIIHGSLIAQTNKFGWCYKFHNCFFFDRTI